MSDPTDDILRIIKDGQPDVLSRIATVLGMDQVEAENASLRSALDAQKAAAPELVGLKDEQWYWVSYEAWGRTYQAPAMYKASVDCFYSFEFSGIPAREATVHYGIKPLGTTGGEG